MMPSKLVLNNNVQRVDTALNKLLSGLRSRHTKNSRFTYFLNANNATYVSCRANWSNSKGVCYSLTLEFYKRSLAFYCNFYYLTNGQPRLYLSFNNFSAETVSKILSSIDATLK